MNRDILDEIAKLDYPLISEGIQDFLQAQLEESGANGFIFGLSGGIDSAVIAYLCRQRFRDRTLALIMPDTSTTPDSETGHALKVVSLTGITHRLIDIRPIVNEYSMYIEPNPRARGNLRARVRTDILYYYANAKGYLVLGSSDRSEYLTGYFTKYGDGGADITPIISLYKLQVRKIAEYLGVPQDIISKRSSPHLWEGHEAEKELGMTYEELDSILYCMKDRGMSAEEACGVTGIGMDAIRRIQELNMSSRHKRHMPQGPGG